MNITTNIPWSQEAAILASIAQKYNIPLPALVGIYGVETDFGQAVDTSSAGAMGPFQFIPGTAQQYGYPLTNDPTLQQFGQQADAWGKFLVANNPSRNPNGWGPAMGGGYTEAQVNAKWNQVPAAFKQALAQAAGHSFLQGTNTPGAPVSPGPGTVGSIANGIAGAIAGVFNQAVSDAKYGALLVLMLLVGGFMILHGVSPKASNAIRVVAIPARAMS